MFEGLISEILTRFLGKYVKDFNKEQLKIGIWGGNVVLKNLEVRGEALAELNLPVVVRRGVLGKVELQVPWKNLSSKPVVVVIDSVYVLCGAQTAFLYDEAAAQSAARDAKRAKLAQYELVRAMKQKSAAEKDKDKGGDGFAAKLVSKIVDNIQVTVNKVHVRYEGRTASGRPYALGVTLEGLSVLSTDENWVPAFLEAAAGQLLRHKLVELKALGLYVEPDAACLGDLPAPSLCAELERRIATVAAPGPLDAHYLLRPVSAQMRVKLSMDPRIDLAVPKVQVECVFPAIGVALSEAQYHSALALVDTLGKYSLALKYIKYRPTVPVKEAPLAWFRYAASVVRDDVRERVRRTSFAHLVERKRQREQYIELYKRSQGVKWLTPLKKEEKAQLAKLEDALSFEDIVFFRSLADTILEKEAQNEEKRADFLRTKKEKEKEKEKALKSSSGGGGGWFSWGRKKKEPDPAASPEPASAAAEAEAEPLTALTEEQMEEVYSLVGYSDAAAEIQPPKEYVQIRGTLRLDTLSLTLLGPETGTRVLCAALEGISAGFAKRTDGMRVDLGINSFTADDYVTQHSVFPKMISTAKSERGSAFMSLGFELNPLDGHADSVVSLAMNSTNIVVTKPFIDRVAAFFRPPTTLSPEAMKNLAADQLWNMVSASSAQLQTAVQQHKTLDLSVIIDAPCIMVPQDASNPATLMLLLDLGRLHMKSDLSKAAAPAPGDVSNMYDKYDLALEKIQVLLANNVVREATDGAPWWRDPALQKTASIIEEFSVNLRLMTCIQPNELTLTTTIVSGELPAIDCNVSVSKYEKLMALVSTFVPPQPTDAVLATESSTSATAAAAADTSLQQQSGAEVIDLTAPGSDDPRASKAKDLLIKHKAIELNFAIKRVSVTLVDETVLPPLPLIRIAVGDLSAQFAKRTWDMHATASLGMLAIEDCIAQRAGLAIPYLATSQLPDEMKRGEAEKLILVNWSSVERGAPTYEKVDMLLDARFNNFHLVINPDTIAALLRLVLSLSKKQPVPVPAPAIAAPAPAAEPAQSSDHQQHAATAAATKQPTIAPSAESRKGRFKTPEFVKTKVVASIGTVGVILMKGSEQVASFSVEGIEADVAMKERTMAVRGKLAKLSVLDPAARRVESLYPDVVAAKDAKEAVIDFAYATFSEEEQGYPGFDASVQAHMRSLQIVPVPAFLLGLRDYVLQGPLLEPLREANVNQVIADQYSKATDAVGSAVSDAVANATKAEPAAEQPAAPSAAQVQQAPAKVSKMKLDVVLEAPEIKVPQSHTSSDMVLVNLGTIRLANEFETDTEHHTELDRMQVALTDVTVQTRFSGLTTPLLRNVDMGVGLTRNLDPSCKTVPEMKLALDMKPFRMQLSETQLMTLLEFAQDISKSFAPPPEEDKKQKKPSSPDQAAPSSESPSTAVEQQAASAAAAVPGEVVKLEEVDALLEKTFNTVPKIAIEFALREFSFELLRNSGTQPEDILALFAIAGTTGGLQVFNEDFTRAYFDLAYVKLSDRRAESPSIYKDLLSCGDEARHLLSATYVRRNSTGDQALTARVCAPKLYVLPSFIIAVKDYFMLPLSRMKPVEEPPRISSTAALEEEDTAEVEEITRLLRDPSTSVPTRCKVQKPGFICFTGEELAGWLVDNANVVDRAQAIDFAGQLLADGHVQTDAPAPAVFSDTKEAIYFIRSSSAAATSSESSSSAPAGTSSPSAAGSAPSPSAASQAAVRTRAALSAKIDLLDPEINILENEKRPDTLCLVASGSFHVSYGQECTGEDRAKIGAEALQVMLLRLENAEKVAGSRAYNIVNPFGMALEYSASDEPAEPATDAAQQPADPAAAGTSASAVVVAPVKELVHTQNVFISMQPIEMGFSYQNLKLVLAVLDSLKPLSQQPGSSSSEPSTSSATTPKLPPPTSAPQSAALVRSGPRTVERLSMECAGICLLLINDFNGRSSPVLEMRVRDLTANVNDWASQMRLAAGASVSADFFNENLMLFEPLLEPWTFSASIVSGASASEPATSLLLTSDIPLNMNISHAFVDSMTRLYSSLSQDYYGAAKTSAEAPSPAEAATSSSAAAAAAPTEFHDVWLVNKTGYSATCKVRYATREGQDVESMDPISLSLPESTLVPLPLEQGLRRNDRKARTMFRIARVFVNSGDTSAGIDGIQLDRVACVVHSVPHGEPIVSEVTWRDDGSKVTTLRSCMLVRNETIFPMEILLQHTVSKPDERPERTLIIEPGACEPVPLGYTSNCKLFVRPKTAENKYAASENVLSEDPKKQLPLSVCKCPAVQPGQPSVYVLAKTTVDADAFAGTGYLQVVVSLHAPMTLHNLLPVRAAFALRNGETTEIPSGETAPFYSFDPRIDSALAVSGLSGGFRPANLALNATAVKKGDRMREKLKFEDGTKEKLELLVDTAFTPGRDVSIYAPYWLVNKTGVPLVFMTTGGSRLVSGSENRPRPPDSQPFMCSLEKLCIRTPDARKPSKNFGFEAVGTTGVAEFMSGDGKTAFGVRVSCSLAPGRFNHTKVVTFSPRYVLVNKMRSGADVMLRQVGSDSVLKLAPGVQTPFNWAMLPGVPDRQQLKRRLCATLNRGESQPALQWSGSFVLDEAGEASLRLRAMDGEPDSLDYYLRMEVTDSAQTTTITFRDETPEGVPFRIENDTPFDMEVLQAIEKTKALPTKAPASQTVRYGWEEPLGVQKMRVFCPDLFGEKPRVLAPTKIRSWAPIRCAKAGKRPVYNYLRADGPTRVLVFTQRRAKFEAQTGIAEKRKQRSLGNALRRNAGGKVAEGQHAQGLVLSRTTVALAGIGVSLITKEPRELAFFSVGGIGATYTQTATDLEVEATVRNIQLDNQAPPSTVEFPIILRGSPTMPSGKDAAPRPWLHFAAVKSTLYTSMDFFTYCSFLMQEINLSVESDFIFAALGFFQSLPLAAFSASPDSAPVTAADELKKASEGWDTEPAKPAGSAAGDQQQQPVEQQQRMAYFKMLHLNPVKVSLTFSSKPGAVLGLPRNPATAILEMLANTVANLDRAPLCFNALMLQHPFCSRDALISRIIAHYTRQGVSEVYKLIGSAEALGNPVGLFNNLGTGVMDFFYEPAAGIVESPAAFGRGLARGAGSLAKNSVYGLFNSVSKVVGAVGKGVATLSFDDDYVRQRQVNQRKQPKHALEGAAQAFEALGMGLFNGITGIVLKPVEGARRGGAKGLFKGIGQGVVGIAVKPVAGVFEFASKATEGVKNTATMFEAGRTATRVRKYPRVFGHEGQLLEYNEVECEGAYLVSQVRELAGCQYRWHAPLDKGRILLLTDKRLAIIESKKIKLVGKAMPLDSCAQCDLVKGGVVIHLKPDGRAELHQSDPNAAMVIFTKVTACVRAFRDSIGQAIAPMSLTASRNVVL